MSFYSLIGKPIEIEGKQVILLPDRVGGELNEHELADMLELVPEDHTLGTPAFYLSERELGRIKQEYPGIPVYGLWHTLFVSGLLKNERILGILEHADTGIYVISEQDEETGAWHLIHSGTFSGMLLEHPDIPWEMVVPLEPDLSQLKLPNSQAMLLEERRALRKQRETKIVIVGAVAAALILAVAGITDFFLKFRFDQKMKEVAVAHQLNTQLQSEVYALMGSRLSKWPSDTNQILQLTRLLMVDPAVSTRPGQRFNQAISLKSDWKNQAAFRGIEWAYIGLAQDGNVDLVVPVSEEAP